MAAIFAGCGSDDSSTTSSNSAATGSTGATPSAATGDRGATAETKPTEPAASPTEPANPNDPGEGDEEAARSVVDIGLKNGSFTKSTARKVHVLSLIPIELSIKVLDSETYNLVITDSDGRERLATYNKQGSFVQQLEGMSANKSTTIVLGGEQQIKITADADPGP